MNNNFLLIGVDGGASKVSACEVIFDSSGVEFKLGELSAQRSYKDIPGFISDFKPVDIPSQLKEQNSGQILQTEDEKQQETVYVEACALVIEEFVKKSHKQKVLVGLGMPGLKTSDKRGIAVVANGPRMLNYSNLLEERLRLSHIEFIAPIYHLGSDADYCGIGENFSADGFFKDTANAYYLGGGTGVADALKLNGGLLPFDQTKEWMAKSWEMKSVDGRSLERFASAGGIQSIYADISGTKLETLNANNIYPLQISEQAKTGDKNSVATFTLVVEQLSQLLYERITTLYSGWQSIFNFMNENRTPLNPKHQFTGSLFEKIIIGQRLGELMQTDHGSTTLFKPLIKRVHRLIQDSSVLDEKAKTHYANLEEHIIISRLREAPALGAGIDAYQNYRKVE